MDGGSCGNRTRICAV